MNMKKHNKGFTLIELGIVVALLTIVTAIGIHEAQQKLRIDVARAQGEQIKVLGEGLYSYGLANYNAIVNGLPVAGVANPQAPTVAELVALGNLTSNFSNTNYYGPNGYSMTIVPSPPACVPPNCNISGMAYMNDPVRDIVTGDVDGPSVGEAIIAIGADGGASIPNGNAIVGTGGGWNVANPLGNVQGILAVRVGAGAELDLTQYLRRDGTLAMTGDLDLGTNNIVGVDSIDATGDINTDGNVVADGNVTGEDVITSGNNKRLSRAITDATIVANGGNVAKPVCLGGQSPQVFLAPTFYSNNAAGGAIQSVQTWAVNNGATWTANMRVLTSGGWVTPSATYGKILAVTKCS